MKHNPGRLLYKMTITYATLFSLLTALILMVVYQVLVRSGERQMELNHQLLINQPLGQVERFLDEMDNIAYQAMISRELINRYAFLRTEANPDNYFTYNIMVSIDTASVLAGINRGTSSAWRICAYNQYGDFIHSGATIDKAMVPDVLELRGVAEMMREFANDGAAYILLGPDSDAWSNYYKSRYVSLIRPIMNVYSRDVVGVVEVQKSVDVLAEYISGLSWADLRVSVYDGAGRPVVLAETEGYSAVTSAVSGRYGWSVVLLEADSVSREFRNNNFLLLFVSWLFISLVVLVIIMVLSLYISRPLTALTQQVQSIRVGEPKKLGEIPTDIKEVHALQSAYNQMIERLLFSLDQEKNAFLMAMQAQMNPHFLYNVLSVINAEALEGRNKTVVGICANLSGMLRYASSFASGTAAVEEELRHTREYLELMKARYDYMFTYAIDADPGFLQEMIPKLVIQSICENAFTHAFSKVEPPYTLDLRIQAEPGGWSITVTDNGPGFDADTARDIMEKVSAARYEQLSEMQIGGLGLISAVLRLKLQTRREVEFTVRNTQPGGAAVKLLVTEQATKEVM